MVPMQLLKRFSIKPIDTHLYHLAFLHESYANEHDLTECYERLEFLGDAVLDLVVSEYLYKQDPHLTEGQLTQMRANYVCKQALYTYSVELGLDQYIKLGVGAQLNRREMDSVISDVFESFIGALYLDLGLETVKKFLKKTVILHIDNGDIFFHDYKSKLHQVCTKEGLSLSYELIKEEGEPHDKTFTMTALVDGETYGTGSGGSKKEAEQNAAKIALHNL
ncbi:ribonuclease 3 [Methanobacterium ferruginis]|nr:ribonuclease 3 [Methanobacterium ferruginis]